MGHYSPVKAVGTRLGKARTPRHSAQVEDFWEPDLVQSTPRGPQRHVSNRSPLEKSLLVPHVGPLFTYSGHGGHC
jgi:hypothetical protein